MIDTTNSVLDADYGVRGAGIGFNSSAHSTLDRMMLHRIGDFEYEDDDEDDLSKIYN